MAKRATILDKIGAARFEYRIQLDNTFEHITISTKTHAHKMREMQRERGAILITLIIVSIAFSTSQLDQAEASSTIQHQLGTSETTSSVSNSIAAYRIYQLIKCL